MKIESSNVKLVQLTQLLSDMHSHDENTLSKILQISHNAIYKIIKKLEHYGVAICTLQNNHYTLLEPLILLDSNKIHIEFIDEIEIIIVESIDSTNNYFKTHLPLKKMSCCFAEIQTQGKGRLNRTWHSPFGKNIYLSCHYKFQKELKKLAGLSLVMSLAVVTVLRELGLAEGVSVKWPNDVLYHGKKIAGILIDMRTESQEYNEVIIGIGLNVNMMSDEKFLSAEPILQLWTSLREALGVSFDRNYVASVLIQQLYLYIQRFEQKNLMDFLKEWQAVDSLMNKQVTLNFSNMPVTGIASGINSEGHLLLHLQNGEIRAFSSGEAFLMKQ